MKDNSIIITPGNNKTVRIIEAYTETICENLFINDTYYGNILMCLTELNEIFADSEVNQKIKFSYETDFSTLIINAVFLEGNHSRQQTNKAFSNNEIRYQLLQTLSDKLQILDDRIIFDFNISALHRSIYESRTKHLKIYFDKVIGVTKES